MRCDCDPDRRPSETRASHPLPRRSPLRHLTSGMRLMMGIWFGIIAQADGCLHGLASFLPGSAPVANSHARPTTSLFPSASGQSKSTNRSRLVIILPALPSIIHPSTQHRRRRGNGKAGTSLPPASRSAPNVCAGGIHALPSSRHGRSRRAAD